MGLEALCSCRWSGGAVEVKALLEARDLILRGDLRRTIPISGMTDVRVEGDALLLHADGDSLSLTLGALTAAKWAKKIATPPP